MGIKVYAKHLVTRIILEKKSHPSICFFSPFILSSLLGLLAMFAFSSIDDPSKIALNYKRFSLLIMLAIAVCWVSIYSKKYVEDSSAEIFSLYDKSYNYITIMGLYPLYIFMVIPYIVLSNMLCPDFGLFRIWLVITLFYVFNLTCLLAFLTKNTTTTVMLLIVYMFSCFILSDKFMAFPLLFNSLGYEFKSEFTKVYLPMLVVSMFFLITGNAISKSRTRISL